jgi:hypothetical protein
VKLPIGLLLGAVAMLYAVFAFMHWGDDATDHWNKRRNLWWFTPTVIIMGFLTAGLAVTGMMTLLASMTMR